jgi:transposase
VSLNVSIGQDKFHGFHQTDGYSGYQTALAGTDIRHVGCWAHARRKFFEADKVASSALTRDALGRIRKLYKLENQSRDDARRENLSDQELLRHRKDLLEQYLKDLHKWFDETAVQTLPSGPAGKALAYTIGQWDKLVRFLEHPWLTPDNNRAENVICPFVVGRKNWLFHGNDAGAAASCVVYTLIETAKMNGREPSPTCTKSWNGSPLSGSPATGSRSCPGISLLGSFAACPRFIPFSYGRSFPSRQWFR